MRIFLGIPLAAPVIRELAAISARLRFEGDGLRWYGQESWHITLQFLGSSNEQQYECIVAQLAKLHGAPVPIELDAVGFFDRAGIFFVGVGLTPELLWLQQQITATTALCGFAAEDRPYRPHITLARNKEKSEREGFLRLQSRIHGRVRFPRFFAQEFVLYESFTKPAGSQYEIRECFPLDG